MAKTKIDPFEAWRQWIDKTERQMNSVMNEFMDSESFGKTQGKAMEALLKMQSSMNHATERYFSTLNLATRTDLLTVSTQLAGLEERLISIEGLLRELGVDRAPTRSTTTTRPKRTKKAKSKTAAPAKPRTGGSAAAKKKTAKKSATKKSATSRKTKRKSPTRRKKA